MTEMKVKETGIAFRRMGSPSHASEAEKATGRSDEQSGQRAALNSTSRGLWSEARVTSTEARLTFISR